MKHYFLIAALVLLSLVGLTSCGKDSPDFPPSTKSEVGFVHSVNIGENTYISLFKDLSVSSLNTDNALVLPKGAFTFVYKNKIYVTDTEHFYKYIPKDGILVQEGNTMLFPSGAKATYICASYFETAKIVTLKRQKIDVFLLLLEDNINALQILFKR